MVKNSNINLLFDATVIANNLDKNAQRSGIYFATYNILKEMLRREELNIFLYCKNNKIFELSQVLKKEFLKYPDLKIINTKKTFIFDKIKYELKKQKNQAKEEKNGFKKNILNILLILISILQKPFDIIININLGKDIKKIDIFLSPMFKTPDIIRMKKIPSYTILYDTIPLIFPEYFPDINKGNHWLLELINSITPDDNFFAISENTKKDFVKYTNINENQITTTLLAASNSFYPCKDQNAIKNIKIKYNIPLNKKYILSLCTLEPRKNLDFAVKNFIKFIEKNNISDCVFVLAGGHWNKFIEQLKTKIDNFDNYKETIIIAGYIDDRDLAPLYSGAEFFVYLSKYEGFGMPPLEAMQCGCPVITSTTTSLPEVVGNAGITVNPISDEEIIEAYTKIYYDKAYRDELSQKGKNRAKEFSWEKCIDIMTDKINENWRIYKKF